MYDLLLVDDELSVIESMRDLIDWRALGIGRVETRLNAIEALECLRRMEQDIVITDIRMPVMDGIALIDAARRAGSDAEFIVLSGYDDFNYARGAMAQGVKHYLLKPCGEAEIAEAVVSAVRSLRARRRDLEGAVAQLERAAAAGDAEQLECALAQLLEDEDRSVAALACAKLMLRSLHKGSLDPEILTELFNLLYEARTAKDLAEPLRRALAWPEETYEARGFVDQVTAYVDAHLDDPRLSLKLIAREVVFLTEDYVGRVFARKVGMTFSQYLLKKRIERAKFLIGALGDDKLYTVAEQIGLGNNPQYFSRLFKRETGYTPGAYRALARRNEPG